MKKKAYCSIAILSIAALLMTGDGFHQAKEQESGAVYRISKTMSQGIKAASSTTSEGDEEPYFSKQWALYNDGTFTVDTNDNNTDMPQFNNGGFENGGGFDLGGGNSTPGGFNSPGSGRGNMPGGRMNPFSNWFHSLSNKVTTAVAGVDVDAKDAWSVFTKTGREVIVAIIDTGFDYTHEDLAASVWTNEKETPGDGVDNDGNGYIDDVYGWDFYNNKAYVYDSKNSSEYDHGTHCAGTIAAAVNNTGIAGIASDANVKIMSIKALGGRDGSGTTESVIDAIKYAESMGAEICNLSFGTSTYDANLESAIKDSNMLFVCAAGNGDDRGVGEDTDTTPLYPASFDLDNIISVANLKCDGSLETSSNYGTSSVDLAAPGTYILSTTAGNDYEYLSGTSMAAPMVTAVAAMVYSYYDDITVLQARQVVLATTESLSSLTGKVATGGMVNAYNALSEEVSDVID